MAPVVVVFVCLESQELFFVVSEVCIPYPVILIICTGRCYWHHVLLPDEGSLDPQESRFLWVNMLGRRKLQPEFNINLCLVIIVAQSESREASTRPF